MFRKKARSKSPIKLKSASYTPHLEGYYNFFHLTPWSGSEKYKIGEFPIILNDSHDFMNDTVVYFNFKENSSTCLLLWQIANEEGEIQMEFTYGTCEIPFDVLQALGFQKNFQLIWKPTYSQSGIIVHVFISPSLIQTLNYASEPLRLRNKVQTVVKHFCGIALKEYGNDLIDQEDHIEKVYKCINNRFDPNKEIVEISHPSLIPKLREYQSQAVHWMLNCESREKSNENDPEIHPLYYELSLRDEEKLYYQIYGGFFVTKRFTTLPLARGGILADEMGLGKTVEVLACILLHPRTEFPSQADQEPYGGCAKQVNNDQQENLKSPTKAKRKKKTIVRNDNTNESKRQKRRVSIFQDKQTKCEECGLILDVSGIPSDFLICPLCSDATYESDFQSSDGAGIYENDSMDADIESLYDEDVECVCGSYVGRRKKKVVRCEKCGLQQHAECVLANISEESFFNYLCPYCWVEPSVEPIPSRATLIVSPSAIIYQWEEEITRHIREDGLKVFMYSGVEQHKFINPKILANYDIVLSSYETFRKEVKYVNVPHGENQRPMRFPKKFRALPSPLLAIEWWRICLDEAQMVEGVTSKAAQMALQLKCINRWCVTGTPIQKSVEDLYGLLLFLGYDPYCEKLWWKELLWKPFASGENDKLAVVLNNVLWRTTKNYVLHQMGIPQQEILLHKIKFSQVEKVFYEHVHSKCMKDFMENIKKCNCEDVNLRSMDKHVLSKILLPMKKLQKACCHFQLAQNNLADIQKNKMSIPELLSLLLKNASYECEEVHRKLILALNGVAGVFSVKEEYENACEMYKKALLSVEEHKNLIRTDILQQIHTLHNYSEVISLLINKEWVDSDIKSIIGSENLLEFKEDLKKKATELSETYLQKFASILQNCKDMSYQIHKEVHKIKIQFKCKMRTSITSNWWLEILNKMDQEEKKSLVLKIRECLNNAPGRSLTVNSVSICERFHDSTGLAYCLISLSDDLHEIRSSLIDAVNNISLTPDSNLLNCAIECHLRPTPGHKAPRCLYCKANDVFCQYEAKLFRFNELSAADEESSDTENICLPELRKGTHADGELELALKQFVNYARHRKDLLVYFEDGNNELKLFDALKKEFKHLRKTWIQMSEYVSSIDEVEMAKMTMRLLLPEEEPPNPPVPYILEPLLLQFNLIDLQSDVISHQNLLKKKLGQLFYLKNLKKAQNSEETFEDICPVCQQKLETPWSVLQCGHSFCLSCMHVLTNSPVIAQRTAIRCPVCREETNKGDTYYIDNPEKLDEEISIKGNYSTKISAIVKCLLQIKKKDPAAKSLVFSTWIDFLRLLECALSENEISFLNLCNKKHFQTNLSSFKLSSSDNVLLLPLNVGANGLNIVQATNVLLTEPVMDNSKVLQAIGRVHRIGQTRQTVVHKFVISSTIEENIHEIHKNDLSSDTRTNPMTVSDLKRLFDEN